MRTPEEVLRGGAVIVESGIRDESRAQGHYLTGGMEKSLSHIAGKFGPFRLLTGTGVDYANFVNSGVSAGRVPFKEGSGAGTSKYIEGLKQFFKIRKGLDDKEALSAAIATAKVHKKEGMPTRSSYQYSSTGSRTGMIETAMTKVEPKLDAHIITGFDNLVNDIFDRCKSETV
jgi:hypothetical protein